jgi:uncharacterized protein (TIGR02246 family)
MTPDESAIRSLIARWHSATAAGDVATVLSLMADDVVFLVAGQPPMRGRAAFERSLRELLAGHRIESAGDVQEVVASGDLAYSWVLLSVRIVPLAGGDATTRAGHAMSILRRQANGSWLVIRDANMLGPAS